MSIELIIAFIAIFYHVHISYIVEGDFNIPSKPYLGTN